MKWDLPPCINAELCHMPGGWCSLSGAWIVVGRGGPWGHGCHLYVVNSPPEQTVEEAMMAAREGGDADVAHVLPRPQSMHLDSELHRSSGTVVWWATHATDADTSPARAAWGLRFVSHKQYVAFKVSTGYRRHLRTPRSQGGLPVDSIVMVRRVACVPLLDIEFLIYLAQVG